MASGNDANEVFEVAEIDGNNPGVEQVGQVAGMIFRALDLGSRRSVGNTGAARARRARAPKARYWIVTIAASTGWAPPSLLPAGVEYMGGQLEEGGEDGYRHWQVIVGLRAQQTMVWLKNNVLNENSAHCEVTRSEAARDYCFKEETRVAGTQFELGEYPKRRNNKRDWEAIKASAEAGRFSEIDAGTYICHYRALRQIYNDKQVPLLREGLQVIVLWGHPGTGKSQTMWQEIADAGKSLSDVYIKDAHTKWWCKYNREEIVVMDDFTGAIPIGLMKNWLDKWPVVAEEKGGRTVLTFRTIYITSNTSPRCWYPNEEDVHVSALLRRITRLEKFERSGNEVIKEDQSCTLPIPIQWPAAIRSQSTGTQSDAIEIVD